MGNDGQSVQAIRRERDTELSWIEAYYESLEFFNQEPQHIGRKRYADAKFRTLSEVKEHLREMEVTLNQNLQQFFSLAPDALRNRLLQVLFQVRFAEPLVMLARDIDVQFALENCMQPDIVFASDDQVASLEMKVGAKCSIDQVLKYALLGLAVEMKQDRERTHFLAILAPGSLASQFREHFPDIASLKEAALRADLTSFLSNKPTRFRKRQARLGDIVASLQVASLSYKRLAEILHENAPSTGDKSPGAEVYGKLISGLIGEFKRRDLA
jgi:hypothetical protein